MTTSASPIAHTIWDMKSRLEGGGGGTVDRIPPLRT